MDAEGPLKVDLNTAKLKALSARPAAQKHQSIARGQANVERMRLELEKAEQKEAERKVALDRMQRLAVQHEKFNPNLSKSRPKSERAHEVETGPDDVDEDEWED
jgi:hypothetical protein